MDAGKILSDWEKELSEDDAIAGFLFESLVKSNLAGQLFVESEEAETIALSEENTERFFNMAFEEALKFFASKRIVTPEEYSEILRKAQENAFSARRLLSERLRTVAFERINASLSGSEGLRQFVEAIRNEEETLGITGESTSYLRTVFHTNIANSYAEGKRSRLTDNLLSRRPILVRRAIIDGRERENHAAYHNKGIDASANPELIEEWTSPHGYNCRCSFVSMTKEQAEKRGVEIVSSRPDGAYPDPGFFFSG